MCSEILVCLAEYLKEDWIANIESYLVGQRRGLVLSTSEFRIHQALALFVTEQVHPATYWWHLASEMPIESFEAMVRAISDTSGIDVPAEFSYQEMIRELSKETTGHAQCEALRLAILVNLVGPKKVSNTLGDKRPSLGYTWFKLWVKPRGIRRGAR